MNNNDYIKPFLRWAGGKSWLAKHIQQILIEKEFNNYHEPFLGGGAIFFSIKPQKQSYLSDLNEELINSYLAVKNYPCDVIDALKEYENNKDFYYQLREKCYKDIINQAARFIYLNQTSYNGLYRVNKYGIYNVPFGYRTKNFLEEKKLLQVSTYLQTATIMCSDFMNTKSNIKEGDLIFLDPPYTVSHNNNGFIKYNQKLFSLEDQYRLSLYIDYIKSIKAYYILTNAAHEKIYEIFNKGDKFIKLERANLIGGENAKRGRVTEYIFTNI